MCVMETVGTLVDFIVIQLNEDDVN